MNPELAEVLPEPTDCTYCGATFETLAGLNFHTCPDAPAPIVTAAIVALTAFSVHSEGNARLLLACWKRRDELTDEDREIVIREVLK